MGVRNLVSFVASLALIYAAFAAVPSAYDAFAMCSTFAAAVWMAEWLMTSTRKHLFYGRVEPEGKAVLITGCDSGFGHALAKRMDSHGYRVFAGCLNATAEGATDLKRACSPRLFVLPLDVTSEQSIQSARDCVEKNLGSDGKFICPGFVGYCMSKCATIAFSEGLRVEMMKWGVKVISIEPFFYKTPLTGAEATDALIEKTWRKADARTREEYGEGYLENFKKSSRRLLSRSSPKVHQVIDCFEDAITAKDPLSTYFPAFLPDKIGIKVLQSLPKVVLDNYLRQQLERGVRPSSLVHG